MNSHFHNIKRKFEWPPVNSLSSFDFMTAGSVRDKCDSLLLILHNWRRHCPRNWNPHCGLMLYTQMIIFYWHLNIKICQTSRLCNETKSSPFHCRLWFPSVVVVLCHCCLLGMETHFGELWKQNGNEFLLFCFIFRQKMPERPKNKGQKQSE